MIPASALTVPAHYRVRGPRAIHTAALGDAWEYKLLMVAHDRLWETRPVVLGDASREVVQRKIDGYVDAMCGWAKEAQGVAGREAKP